MRTLRQRHGFSEDELAFLISHQSHAPISRIELGRSIPNLCAALALQVLFRQEPKGIFPGLYQSVGADVLRRVRSFLEDLEGCDDRRSRAKRGFLEAVLERALEDDGL